MPKRGYPHGTQRDPGNYCVGKEHARTQDRPFAARYRLPAITMFPELSEVGGLMAYGTNLMHLYRQAGALVGKVLSGDRPADMAVEGPMRFQVKCGNGSSIGGRRSRCYPNSNTSGPLIDRSLAS